MYMYLQKVTSRKKCVKKLIFAGILKFNDENIRIRIRIYQSEAWICGSGSGSTPKCHGSWTLLLRIYPEKHRYKMQKFSNVDEIANLRVKYTFLYFLYIWYDGKWRLLILFFLVRRNGALQIRINIINMQLWQKKRDDIYDKTEKRDFNFNQVPGLLANRKRYFITLLYNLCCGAENIYFRSDSGSIISTYLRELMHVASK
jgi:hypothetical protein